MSPERAKANNNLYTIILGAAFLVVLGTTLLAAYYCYVQYGTLFKIP